MKLKDFIKNQIMSFFIITTLINLFIMIMGMIFRKNDILGYDAFSTPLIYAFLSILPSAVMYSAKELTFRQMIIRKVIQLVLIELIVVFACFGSKIFSDEYFVQIVALCISVFIIYILVNLISWLLDKRQAEIINENLKNYQTTHSNS